MADKAKRNPPVSFEPQLLPEGEAGGPESHRQTPSCPLINHRYLQVLTLSNTAVSFGNRLKVGPPPRHRGLNPDPSASLKTYLPFQTRHFKRFPTAGTRENFSAAPCNTHKIFPLGQ